MAGRHQFCTFYLDPYYFGIDVRAVQEVILHQELTVVPLAPPEVRGVINLRGQIVTAIDLRRRLELPDLENKVPPVHVVVQTQGELVSFLVDKVGDVIDVDADHFEHAPDTLKGVAQSLIQGAYKLPSQLLLALDPEKTVDLDLVVS